MGIQGLIPFLEKASRPSNISQFSGCCVAIDAYCWLHKGAFVCAEKLARGDRCDAYVYYCIKFVNMLLSHNIKPILVFDGRHLPAKAGTEKKRRELREVNRKRAAELLRGGRVDEARNYLRRCIDVTHEMALVLIKECRRLNVDSIVAPYEADAQLAYLNRKGIADVVITEDSDLVLFGCSKIMFKMDVMGNGLLVEQENLHLAMGVRVDDFSFDKFRYMCILSGCDYLPSLPGIGLGKALKFFTRTEDPDIHRALSRIPAYLNMRHLKVTQEYREEFVKADATFRYQLVFDPSSRSLVPLNEYPESQDVPDIVGENIPPDVAFQLALGNLDPFTLQKMDDFDPDTVQKPQNNKSNSWVKAVKACHPSIWSASYKVQARKPFLQNDEENINPTHAFVDVKLLKPRTQPIEDTKILSSLDLTSMYSNSEQQLSNKRLHIEDSLDLECSTKKKCVEEVTKTDDPDEKACDVNGLHIKVSTESSTSPVLVRKKCRNPFMKRHTEEPKVKLCSEVLRNTECTNKKFSALSKWSSVLPPGTTGVVRSRYFTETNVGDKTGDVHIGVGSNLVVSETLKDVSNVIGKVEDNDLCETKCYASNIHLSNNDEENVPTDKLNFHATGSVGDDSPFKISSQKHAKLFKSDSENTIESESTEMKKQSSSIFNWNQFQDKFGFNELKTCRTLSSSVATKKVFRKPWKKQSESSSVTKCSPPLEDSGDQEMEHELCSSGDSGFQSNTEYFQVENKMPIEACLTSVSSLECSNKEDHVLNDQVTCTSKLRETRTSLSMSKSTCRISGLQKSTNSFSKKQKSNSSQQSLLSMFGFQKKLNILHTSNCS